MARTDVDFEMKATVTADVPDGLSGRELQLAKHFVHQHALFQAMGIEPGTSIDLTDPGNQDNLYSLAERYGLKPQRVLEIFNGITLRHLKGKSSAGDFELPLRS